MERIPGQWRGGPFSKNFPEREAARLVREGVLRLDPDGSVWRLQKVYVNGRFPVAPRRIDWGSPRGQRSLKVYVEGVAYTVGVARLVWQMNKGDIPPMLTVNHKDGNPAHNHIDNLELLTHSEQHKHRYRVLGHKAPGTVNRDLAERFAGAARVALETGNLESLRAALKAYDERSFGDLARYKRAAQDRLQTAKVRARQI